MRLLALSFLFSALPAFSQIPTVDIGIRVGRPQTPLVEDQYYPYTGLTQRRVTIIDPPYTVGPTVEAGFTKHLAVQFEPAYKLLRMNAFAATTGVFYSSGSTRASWWEFPITGKWRFSNQQVQPFASGGIAFNRVRGQSDSVYHDIANDQDTRSSYPFTLTHSTFGWIVGGGVELPSGPFRIAPEIRYIHWTTRPSGKTSGVFVYPNQFDIVIGFKFRALGQMRSRR